MVDKQNVFRKLFLENIKKNYQLILLLLPGLTYIVVFHYIPMYGAQIAFKDFSPALGFLESPWVGLDNFFRFFNSYSSKRVIWNTLYLGLLSLFITFPAPVLLALLLNQMRSRTYKKLVQTLTYAPHFISTVVMVGMMYLFLSPNNGIINQLVSLFGFDQQLFMGSSDWFRTVYIISEIWQSTGWGMILYLATLSNVDVSLYEASKMDGANKFQQILHIDIPVLMNVFVVVFILRAGRIMGTDFEKIFLMQSSSNLGVSELISTYVYKVGLLQADFSYSTAVGLFNSLVNFILLFVVNGISKRLTDNSLL